MDYKVRDLPQEVLDDAKPRNILEEIVWYKAREIEAWKERTPLPSLMVSSPAAIGVIKDIEESSWELVF